MANEIQFPDTAGLTLYAVVVNGAGLIWTGAAFVAEAGGDWPSCAIALTDAAGVGIYHGNFPAVPAGRYLVIVYQQIGGAAASTDPSIGHGGMDWDGVQEADIETIVLAANEARDASIAVLEKLGTVTMVLEQPMTSTGMLRLIAGADYFLVDGMAIVWTQSGTSEWPSLIGASVTWEFSRHDSAEVLVTFDCTVVNASTVQLELSRAQTSTIPYTRSEIPDRYELWAMLADGHRVRVAQGTVFVER